MIQIYAEDTKKDRINYNPFKVPTIDLLFMQTSGLVSIITPCYNSAAYIHRLLDSVLIQDYPSIEMFVIDDGSTDNTQEIIKSYIPKYQERGYNLTYIYQDNAGQASAVNRGLKLVNGEFLAWPDSDDYYNRVDSISTFVNELTNLDCTYGLVCFIGSFVDENTLENKPRKTNYNRKEKLFETCLLGGDFLAVPINYMIRMNSFDEVNPQREIYTGQRAQNMQMLLPVFYSYKCRTVNISLCNIVERSSSDSHKSKSYDCQTNDITGWLDIKINTLSQIREMPEKERKKYARLSQVKYFKSKLELAFIFKNKQDVRANIDSLEKMGVKVGVKKRIKATLLEIPLVYNFLIYLRTCFLH